MAPPNQQQQAAAAGPNASSRKRRNPFPNKRNRRGGPATANSPGSAPYTTASTAPAAVGAEEAVSSAVPTSVSTSFAELARYNVDPTLLETIQSDMKMSAMTVVQNDTLPATLTGHDVLAQAKTGTGKTIAFLLPAIQKMVSNPTLLATAAKNRPVSTLIISPTRELATQIAAEAKALLQRKPGFRVEAAFGGTSPSRGLEKALLADILVATPGRLLDYLGQPDSDLTKKMQGVQTLVLDEADRLMDMGFLPSIQKIVKYLPPKATTTRQGMLFSATMSPRVEQFASLVCGPGYKFICCIPKGALQTHEHVPQGLISVPRFEDLLPALHGALRMEERMVGKGLFKAIVFAPTAAQAELYALVLGRFADIPKVLHVSSRMSQSKRTKATDEYRSSTSSILVATDVVARGLDFPGVTTVIQVGLPSDKEAYIHRLGRTARAGAQGRGLLVLTEAELPFAKETMKMVTFEDVPLDLTTRETVARAISEVDGATRKKMYRGWLGYYKSCTKTLGWTNEQLVAEANTLAKNGLKLDEVPELEARTVGKMGLKGVKGLNVVKNVQTQPARR